MHLADRYSGLTGIMCLLLVSAGLTSPGLAAQSTDRDITRQELRNFDTFLDSHPAIAAT
jgi:hypothetical protein